MIRPIIRVVKVGGSLFDFAELPAALSRWLDAQPPATNIFVAGGGALVDKIRQADEMYRLGEEASHWLSVDLMDVNGEILAKIINVDRTSSFERLRAIAKTTASGERIIFLVAAFLREIEPQLDGSTLPHDWTVTSDSIAARVAECLGAHELVLLKSMLRDFRSCSVAVESGYIDGHFELAAARIPAVRFVDLRSTGFRESHWPIHS